MITLKQGDCLEVMKEIPDESVDLILTDPPYNLGNFMKNRATNLKKMRENFFGAAGWDDLEYDEWVESMDNFFKESVRLLKSGGSMLVFMSIIKVETLIKLAEKNGLYYKTTGIWHKLNPMPRNMNLQFVNSTEAWVYFTYKAKTGTFNNEGKIKHDFYESAIVSNGEKKAGKHPTQKPIQLMEHFINLLTFEGETIMDPFMGSGSTGVASKSLGRNFIGIELSPEYFDIANQRIEVA
jgi:site-specific DNA-methyltransferase (adenine-specific)/modification methylase